MSFVFLGMTVVTQLSAVGYADVLKVPEDFPTIREAIDVAQHGDTVLVAPGVYHENLFFQGKSITVASTEGAASTVIDGSAASTVVKFVSGEGRDSVLRGFTIRNGRAQAGSTFCSSEGGGICVSNSSPTIVDNVIVDNVACSGAGIAIRFSSPLVRGNTISRNRQGGCGGGTGGGGIAILGAGSARIVGNLISENETGVDGGGIACFAAGTPTIEGNVIQGNSAQDGGGISLVNRSDALITGNLIIENRADQGGGISWLVPGGAIGPRVVNNTIADNNGFIASGVLADGFDRNAALVNNIIVAANEQTAVFCDDFNDLNPPRFSFNNVFSPSGLAYDGICGDPTGGNGNISAPPRFRDAPADDYRLLNGSPNIDAGDNGAFGLPLEDIEGKPRVLDGDGDTIAVVDMGAYERALLLCNVDLAYSDTLTLSFDLGMTEPVTWSVWIALFNRIVPLWSLGLPAFDPAVSFDVPWEGFPSIGHVAVISSFSTANLGLVCLDIDAVDTGGFGNSEESSRHLLLRDNLGARTTSSETNH